MLANGPFHLPARDAFSAAVAGLEKAFFGYEAVGAAPFFAAPDESVPDQVAELVEHGSGGNIIYDE
ncbi:hypothetical protein [Photobacterium marinum]|uniref:hypothetical protein n=1 Tax=Photobacterium marinum TaxID=1056511 RepID=UPI000565A12C|nr:hypothetical protein [Photobacterium marinum]